MLSNPETEAFRIPNQEPAMKTPISLNPFALNLRELLSRDLKNRTSP